MKNLNKQSIWNHITGNAIGVLMPTCCLLMVFGSVPSVNLPIDNGEQTVVFVGLGQTANAVIPREIVAGGGTTWIIECWHDESEVSTPIAPIGVPRNTCIVSSIAADNAITTYVIAGPLATAEYRERHKICVYEKQKTYKTYVVTPRGRRWFGLGRKTATIGTDYCV